MNGEEKLNKNTTNTNPDKTTSGGSKGPVVGSIIIIILLIITGIYILTSRQKGEDARNEIFPSGDGDEILNLPDKSLESLESQSESDELEMIEKDILDTNLEGLDIELDSIEQELGEVL